MKLRNWLVWVCPLLASLVPLAGGMVACGSDSLVGGGCREGLSECSLKCVDLQNDAKNCGACGSACPSSLICFGGTCQDEGAVNALRKDGGDAAVAADSGASDVSTGDVSNGDSPSGDGAPGDGPGSDGPGGDGQGDGNACVPPFDNAEHCGDCDTQCSGATPVCGLQGTYKCLAACEAPLEACGAVCVDKFSDENNCGMCGNVCPSAICQAGKCVGKGFGHEIVIGMDYSDATLSPSSAQVSMLANSVLFVGKTDIHVLSYDEFLPVGSALEPTIEKWIKDAAVARGRTVTFTRIAKFGTIPQTLAVTDYQVFLVYDQSEAPADAMATAGTLWNGAVDAFAKGGGVVVVLDGGSRGGMKDLLTNSSLLPVIDETDVAGTQLKLDAPTDIIGLGLPSVFLAKPRSVAFSTTQTADNHHVFVVKDQDGQRPVVVHSVP